MIKHYRPSTYNLRVYQLGHARSDPRTLFARFVNNYMRRQATYKGDILAAFQIILVVLGRSAKMDFLWEPPFARFELTLPWDAFHGFSQRNRSLCTSNDRFILLNKVSDIVLVRMVGRGTLCSQQCSPFVVDIQTS